MADLAGIAAHYAARDAAHDAAAGAVRPGCESRLIWGGEPGEKTPLVVLYLHGFSASPAELDPVPPQVAAAFGATYLAPRLSGHGQDGAAMGQATLTDWQADTRAALRHAAALGDQLAVISCSTGTTLLLPELVGSSVAASLMVSPNLGLASRLGQTLLDLPGAPLWGRLITGRERSFPAVSDAHAALWTLRYDARAIHTLAAAIRAARAVNPGKITCPGAIFANPNDQVVSIPRAKTLAARWGGPLTWFDYHSGEAGHNHLIMGDVFAPDITAQAEADMTGVISQVTGLGPGA